MKLSGLGAFVLFACVTAFGGKQKVVVILSEPLRAENVQILLPEMTSVRGEVRDLEKTLWLGEPVREDRPAEPEPKQSLELKIRTAGRQNAQVTLVLPHPGYVELSLRDFYGKNLETVAEGQFQSGQFHFSMRSLADDEKQGIRFLTLKLNGRVVLKKVLSRVQ